MSSGESSAAVLLPTEVTKKSNILNKAVSNILNKFLFQLIKNIIRINKSAKLEKKSKAKHLIAS